MFLSRNTFLTIVPVIFFFVPSYVEMRIKKDSNTNASAVFLPFTLLEGRMPAR